MYGHDVRPYIYSPLARERGGNMHEYDQPERRLCVRMHLPLLIPILIIEERTWKYDLSPKFFGSVHEMWFPRMLAKGSLLVIG